MLIVACVALVAASALALKAWRQGLYAFVGMAFAQDLMRKLTDGQPPIYILFAGVVFAAAAAGAWASGARVALSSLPGWKRFSFPVSIFLLIAALQALNGFLRIGSPIPCLLSLAFYTGPLLLLGVSSGFVASLGPVRFTQFLGVYVVLGALGASTIAMQAAGVDWAVFGEVGSGIQLYDASGLVASNCGVFRAAEIAGWHAATAAALGVVLLTRRGFDPSRVAAALILAAALAWLAVLTGRRKALLMILMFGGLYFALVSIFVRRALRFGLILGAAAAVAVLASAALLQSDDASGDDYHPYIDRAGTVFSDLSNRFYSAGWAPLQTVYNAYGPLGGGLGLSTQGAQYAGLANDADVTGGAGEGGIGKLAIELGFPGLAAAFLLFAALTRHVLRILAVVGARSASSGRLLCGLTAVLAANVANFSVAAQTYGDVFVVTFLGLILGAILAAPGHSRAPLPVASVIGYAPA
jgi:hypothetical protein